jgi:hypothetical protein
MLGRPGHARVGRSVTVGEARVEDGLARGLVSVASALYASTNLLVESAISER